MDPKKWYASKTIWFNVLLPLVAYAAYKVTGQTMPANVAADAYAVIATLGNIVLRLITKQPIDGSAPTSGQ